MTRIERDVFHVTGTDVNWVLLRDGRDLTLIDGGYPADAPAVEFSARALGTAHRSSPRVEPGVTDAPPTRA